jgi:D-aminopeptidase
MTNPSEAGPIHPGVERLFADWRGERPGGAVAVVRGDQVVHRNAYGLADLAAGEPFRCDHRFAIASVTKHMTTLCVLLLEAQGRFSLEDRVQDRFPGLLSVEAPITIRHLCNNTSGLRDYITLATYAGGRLITDLRAPAIEALIRGQTTLNFEPGSQYCYSNSNFVVLSWILEQTTGWPLPQVFSRLLFEPLGMSASAVIPRSTDVPPGAARGYSGVDARFAPWSWGMDLAGEGGVWSTLDDLIRWERNFSRPVVGGERLLRRLGEVQLLNDGRPSEYALGLRRGLVGGRAWEGHSGGWEGYRSFRLRLPAEEIGIVVLANHTADIQAAALEVAQSLLTWSAPLEAFEGVYASGELAADLYASVSDGQLLLTIDSSVGRQSQLQLCRVGEHEFRLSRAARALWNLEFDTTIVFAPPSDGRSPSVTLSSELARDVAFQRT